MVPTNGIPSDRTRDVNGSCAPVRLHTNLQPNSERGVRFSHVRASNGECGANPQLFRSGDLDIEGSPNASPALVESSDAENAG